MRWVLLGAAILPLARPALAQTSPGHGRAVGSGTSWLPDATPMHMLHAGAGAWTLMVHGNLFLYYVDEGSDRGDSELGSIHWLMAMASRPLAGGTLELRGMFSAEPATVPGCGYPDLLASGEVCEGRPIVDEQHPHDLFMELATRYARELAGGVGVELYAGVAGEPALGPVAYPHRLSAFPNPLAPITHHWMDATHVSFGVVTAGLFGRSWKLEGSVFNGREPDEERWDLDLAPLDSFAGRVFWRPGDRWALQLSAGRLKEAEIELETGERRDVVRLTGSATYHHPLASGVWATTAAWGRNDETGEPATNAFLVESALDAGANVAFARVEWVQKSPHDLALDDHGDEVFWVGKLSLGVVREAGPLAGLVPGLGVQVMVSAVPEDLEAVYGRRFPVGFVVFARLYPAAAPAGHAATGAHPGSGRRRGSPPARRSPSARPATSGPPRAPASTPRAAEGAPSPG